MSEEPSKQRIYCNRCKGTTWHLLVASHEYHFGEGEGDDEWGEYRLWRCAGCDTCVMEDHYSGDYLVDQTEDGEWQSVYESAYHPKRSHSIRARKYFAQLPPKLRALYGEVMAAYNEDLRILCASGLRALVEGICADKKISGSSLEQRIGGMTHLLPESIVINLHGFRFIGNRAVHELEAPHKYELGLAIDVIEDILNFLYALDYKASLLGKMKAAKEAKERVIPSSSDSSKDAPIASPLDAPADPQKN